MAAAHGEALGAQVIDTSHEVDVKNSDDLVLTSRVTTRLRHPCIVRTMAHCVTAAPSSKPWDSAHSAPSRSSSKRDACWMMLEYCDKGTLQVRPSSHPHPVKGFRYWTAALPNQPLFGLAQSCLLIYRGMGIVHMRLVAPWCVACLLEIV